LADEVDITDMSKRARQKARRRERLDQERVEQRRRSRRSRVGKVSLALIGGLAVTVLVINSVRGVLPVAPPEGTTDVAATERNHVEGEVDYETTPAAGGPHASVWQNCGYYDEPIADENAVHSLEHGAVWIAYDPDLDAGQVSTLRDMAGGHVLVSPYEESLEAPVIASAWGKQLVVESADDPRINEFVRAFEQGPQTPERGAVCTRGIGEPE
jgi:hypothetical protein